MSMKEKEEETVVVGTSKIRHEIIQRPKPSYRNSTSKDKNMAPAKYCSVRKYIKGN